VTQKAGKRVVAFAVEGDVDAAAIKSNTFDIQWPPRSGRMQRFPEIDRAEWLPLAAAREKILPVQLPLLDRLIAMLEK
jgi:predicted NUDIX family NTP pyrophosphohydrolase